MFQYCSGTAIWLHQQKVSLPTPVFHLLHTDRDTSVSFGCIKPRPGQKSPQFRAAGLQKVRVLSQDWYS
jgi:hypothetical protein